MACNCNDTQLLGSLSLAPIKAGGRFQFGYNTGYGTGPVQVSDIADMLNAQGITRDAVSFNVSGTLSYYNAIEGKAAKDYGSASDLRDAIYGALVAGGYSIDPATINFNFEPAPGSTSTPQVVYTGPGAGGAGPGVPGASIFDDLAASLGVTRNTAQAVVIGGGLLLLVMVLKR